MQIYIYLIVDRGLPHVHVTELLPKELVEVDAGCLCLTNFRDFLDVHCLVYVYVSFICMWIVQIR